MLHPDSHLPWILDRENEQEIRSLLDKVGWLEHALGTSVTGDNVESLESRIRDAAHEAEEVLESDHVDRILSFRKSRSLRFFHSIRSFFKGRGIKINPPGLQQIIREFESIEEEIKEMASNSSSPSAAVVSSWTDPNPNNILVGLSLQSVDVMELLLMDQTKLETIPIIGMGGIGKTTLAQNVYNSPFIFPHFVIRAWVTISQNRHQGGSNLKRILIALLGFVVNLTDAMLEEENDQLGVRLRKELIGRRYLIVLDDMWLTDDLDGIKRYLPDDENGSRIMVTTRETNVANYAASHTLHHQMHLLNEQESWELLRQKVFAQENCTLEFTKIGERIAKNCGGLPLAIHVIGGVLSQEKKEKECWEQVADNVRSIVARENEQFSKILSLSYEHLPGHLKPCFLYMGAFPEDFEIRRSRITRLWAAEGFLKTTPGKSPEEAANIYLKALVDRNLIFIREKASNGLGKSYGMHDLLRELCARKACQEKFLHVMNRKIASLPEDSMCLRRVSTDSSYCTTGVCILEEKTMTGTARSILHTGNAQCRIFSVVSRLRLLKVLDISRMELPRFPREMPQLVNLRFLAISCFSHLPCSISSLTHLETIIFEYKNTLSTPCVVLCPSGWVITAILDMRRLQHVVIKKAFYPCELGGTKSFADKVNLRSLTGIEITKDFVQVILKSVPNLKKLGCCTPLFMSEDIDLSCLLKLETFVCQSQILQSCKYFFNFPPSLEKLDLANYELLPQHLKVIGELPNLQVLKLRECKFSTSKWDPAEGEFARVHFLLLEILNLKDWEADETNFPRLRHLVLRYCSKLDVIPTGIGDIQTLEMIEVHKSSDSAVDSARKIREEQRELGNFGLKVRIIR